MSEKFDIRSHVEFDTQSRAICPSCSLIKGPGYSKRNLTVSEAGQFYCHRGCSYQDIRNAIGAPIDRPLPLALTPNNRQTNVTVTPQVVKEACDRLLDADRSPTLRISSEWIKRARQWLNDRGIHDGLIERHRLGITRAKVGNIHMPAIAIPIPANADGTQYYQKKRIAPWLNESEQPENYKPWSQYGIPNRVWFTWLPSEAQTTYLCEGEWDAIRLGALLSEADAPIACATFTSGCTNVPDQEQLGLLQGKVVIFYDRNDNPLANGTRPSEVGALKAARALGDRSRIALVPMPEGCEVKGWDICNAIDYGYTLDDFHSAAAAATTPKAETERQQNTRINPLKAKLTRNRDLIDRAADYIDWLVPDLFTPNELFILGTPPRTGKSLFCLTLAKAIATGGTFLDRPVTQGSVVYINCEDSETKVKYRQTAQGWEQWGYDLPVYWLDEFKLSQIDDLREIIEEIGDVRLLVLDTLSRVRDDNVKESSSEMGRILEPLQQMARQMGICILVTHHVSKAVNEEGQDPFNLLRGNSSIRSTCRGAMVMIAEDSCYRLISENGWTDRMDLKVRINSDTLEWKLLGNWQPRIDGDMKAQILDHLNLVGQATIQDIASALNFNAGSVTTVLHRLQREDMVEKIGGRGRQLAHYKRSANLCQQLDVLLGQPNLDTASNTACPNKKIKDSNLGEKVITPPESDHDRVITFDDRDHFSSNTPILLGQSCNPDPVSVPCPNSTSSLLGQVGTNCHTPKERIDPINSRTGSIPQTGDRVVYVGAAGSMSALCGARRLKVIDIHGDMATVKHDKWVVSQTIPIADLRKVE